MAAAILDVGYRLSFMRDRAHAVDLATRNPLAGGAWDALAGIGLATLALAVGLALCAHAAVAVREQRVDLSVGAALGLPLWQRLARPGPGARYRRNAGHRHRRAGRLGPGPVDAG